MQIKKAISDWANSWFFVKEKKPRVIIGIGSALIGVAAGVGFDFQLRAQGVFREASQLTGLIVCLAVGFLVLIPTCGIYNLCRWLVRDKSAKMDKT
jgi:hypothetical protein